MPRSLAGRRVLVVGANGRAGSLCVAVLRSLGIEVEGAGRRPSGTVAHFVDTTDAAGMRRLVMTLRPDIVIDAAAMTDVDACQRDPELAHIVNGIGAGNIARASAAVGARHIHIGTDWVFGDTGNAPFTENAAPEPVNHYGASKLAGERAVLTAHPDAVIARTAWVYGGVGKHFPATVLRVLATRPVMDVVDDARGNPTSVVDLVDSLVTIAASDVTGRALHVVGAGEASRYEVALAVADLAGIDRGRIHPISSDRFHEQYPDIAPRPLDTRLDTLITVSYGIFLPAWQESLARWFADEPVARTEGSQRL